MTMLTIMAMHLQKQFTLERMGQIHQIATLSDVFYIHFGIIKAYLEDFCFFFSFHKCVFPLAIHQHMWGIGHLMWLEDFLFSKIRSNRKETVSIPFDLYLFIHCIYS